MAVTGKMNYIVKDLLTTFESELIKELNKQRLDAEVIIQNHEYLETGERVIINIGVTQFQVRKTGAVISLRDSNAKYIDMYNIEVLVTYLRNFAKDELDSKIKYLVEKRRKFGD